MTPPSHTICPLIVPCEDTAISARWFAGRVGRRKARDHSSSANCSVFQRVLEIADSLSNPGSKIVIVGKQHQEMAASQMPGAEAGTLIAEPAFRDTAAALFLGLSHVRSYHPAGIVVLLPIAHILYPEKEFVRALKAITARASMLNEQVVVLGVPRNGSLPPHGSIRPDIERGWIADFCLRSADAFMDRRHPERNGALWNTMILVAKAQTLWKMGCVCFPEIVRPFERYRAMLGTGRESAVLEEIYANMPRRNLLADLLQPCSRDVAIMEVNGVFWCDAIDTERKPAARTRPELASEKIA